MFVGVWEGDKLVHNQMPVTNMRADSSVDWADGEVRSRSQESYVFDFASKQRKSKTSGVDDYVNIMEKMASVDFDVRSWY
eukprot:2569121-Prymnesium_polylepis.1